MGKYDDFEWLHEKGSIQYQEHIYEYSAIKGKMEVLASSLLELVKLNSCRIGIYLDRCEWLVVAPLTMLYMGLTYVPLDVDIPLDRIQYITKDCNLDIIITNTNRQNAFTFTPIINVDELKNNKPTIVCNYGQATAYILYTSGTTGRPKGVEVQRESLVNFIIGIDEAISLSSSKKIACITNIAFDIFFLESIAALARGLCVVIFDYKSTNNPKSLSRFIYDKQIDILQMTPSRMQLLLNYDNELECLSEIKKLLIGGENFPLPMLLKLQNKLTASIYNLYGPTETTIWSTVADLTESSIVHLGFPIRNTSIYLIDEDGNEADFGEIYIGGEGLAKGYINDQEHTKYVFAPVQKLTNERMYKTGDIGKMCDGKLIYIGRIDNQVKINGHRVELEEIEQVLSNYPDITQCIVHYQIVENEAYSKGRLVAIFTSKCDIEKNELLLFMQQKLPKYMIPAKMYAVASFMYTTNGKIDRKNTILQYFPETNEAKMSKN